MMPAVINILPGPKTGTFSGDEKAPTGQSGHGDEFQSLVKRALWQSLQHTNGRQTENAETTLSKLEGKLPGKSSSKKSGIQSGHDISSHIAAPITANPSVLAEIAALVENSKNLPAMVPSLPIPLSTTVAKGLSVTAAEETKASSVTNAQPAKQILTAQIAMPAANSKQIIPVPVADPEISTGENQSEPATDNKPTAEKIQSLAEMVSVLPEQIKDAKNSIAEKGSPSLPLAAGDVMPKNVFNGKIEVPAPANPKVQMTTQVPPEIHGTVVAKQDVQVKKSENATEIAGRSGQTEKVLPTKTSSVPVVKDLPVEFSVPVNAGKPIRAFVDKISPALPAQSNAAAVHAVAANSPADDKLTIENPAPTSMVSDTNARAVERTHNLMALHAIQLRDSNAASVRVVIKPETGMQLSLELRQRGDGVDARAILQQGDFNQWNQQWPELQQRLEQRGIKLAPLADENFLNGENHSFQHGQQQPAKRELPDELPADFSFSTLKPKTAARSGRIAAADNCLESWA